MYFDALTTAAVAHECQVLVGGRVQQVVQVVHLDDPALRSAMHQLREKVHGSLAGLPQGPAQHPVGADTAGHHQVPQSGLDQAVDQTFRDLNVGVCLTRPMNDQQLAMRGNILGEIELLRITSRDRRLEGLGARAWKKLDAAAWIERGD